MNKDNPPTDSSSIAQPASMQKSRTLDFIVFGLPRSGTTIVVKAINLCPGVLCGSELFTPRADFTTLIPPDCFLDKKYIEEAGRPASNRNFYNNKIERGVEVFGNKAPRYYIRLGHVKSAAPNIKKALVHRNPENVAASWNKRAAASKDSWPTHQTGDYSLAELAICWSRMRYYQDTIFVPYDEMFDHSPDLLISLLTAMGANPRKPDHILQRFDKKLLSIRPQKQQTQLTPSESEFAQELNLAAFQSKLPVSIQRIENFYALIEPLAEQMEQATIKWCQSMAQHQETVCRENFFDWRSKVVQYTLRDLTQDEHKTRQFLEALMEL